jgi:hypothetical protein
VVSTTKTNLLLFVFICFFLLADKMIFFADSLHTELQQSSENVWTNFFSSEKHMPLI